MTAHLKAKTQLETPLEKIVCKNTVKLLSYVRDDIKEIKLLSKHLMIYLKCLCVVFEKIEKTALAEVLFGVNAKSIIITNMP